MEGGGFAATPKDLDTWTSPDFVAAGFWVDDCVAVGSSRELSALAKGIDVKYGTTGLGEVRWVLGMLLERFNLTSASGVVTPLTPGAHLSDRVQHLRPRPFW